MPILALEGQKWCWVSFLAFVGFEVRRREVRDGGLLRCLRVNFGKMVDLSLIGRVIYKFVVKTAIARV